MLITIKIYHWENQERVFLVYFFKDFYMKEYLQKHDYLYKTIFKNTHMVSDPALEVHVLTP